MEEFFTKHLHDDVLYIIMMYVAPPTETSLFLCQVLCSLSKGMRLNLRDHRDGLWVRILRNEYGEEMFLEDENRRSSKRLRVMRSPIIRIQKAHWLICHKTRAAHFHLSEMAHSKQSNKCLSLVRLRGIFDEFGPMLRCNHPVDIGGTFLIEVCRARYVSERIILKCAKYLVEKQGSLPDIRSGVVEGGKNLGLTPLCICAARGMPSLVKYLLKVGASPTLKSSGRFRLFCNGSKTFRGVMLTPLEFASQMHDAETREGADRSTLTSLKMCIRTLSH